LVAKQRSKLLTTSFVNVAIPHSRGGNDPRKSVRGGMSRIGHGVGLVSIIINGESPWKNDAETGASIGRHHRSIA
jgi:hypothetical protein